MKFNVPETSNTVGWLSNMIKAAFAELAQDTNDGWQLIYTGEAPVFLFDRKKQEFGVHVSRLEVDQSKATWEEPAWTEDYLDEPIVTFSFADVVDAMFRANSEGADGFVENYEPELIQAELQLLQTSIATLQKLHDDVQEAIEVAKQTDPQEFQWHTSVKTP